MVVKPWLISWEELRRLKCRDLPEGLRHVMSIQGRVNPQYVLRPIDCSCLVKPGDNPLARCTECGATSFCPDCGACLLSRIS